MAIIIKAARLIYGDGRPALDQPLVTVEDGRVRAVGQWPPVPSGAPLVDLDGLTLLPGLADVHVHLFGERPDVPRPIRVSSEAERALRAHHEVMALLRAGFTAIRDLGSLTAPALRAAIDEGLVPGPRMIAAGAWITSPGGTWTEDEKVLCPARTVAGIERCAPVIRDAIRDGATVIKLGLSGPGWGTRPALSLEEASALVAEAHLHGLRVAAHAMGDVAVRTAIEAGVDTIEHGYGALPDTYSRIADRGIVLVPTLTLPYLQATFGAARGVRPERQESARALIEQQREAVQRARGLGLHIATGTDSVGPPLVAPDEHNLELRLLVDSGLSPAEAIVAATSAAARAMGLGGEVGVVAAGCHADLIGTAGDPTADIAAIDRVRFVMKAGEIVRFDSPEAAADGAK